MAYIIPNETVVSGEILMIVKEELLKKCDDKHEGLIKDIFGENWFYLIGRIEDDVLERYKCPINVVAIKAM